MFVVIGVVVYLFANSNKNATVTTKTTESSGLGNILGSLQPGALKGIFTGIGK